MLDIQLFRTNIQSVATDKEKGYELDINLFNTIEDQRKTTKRTTIFTS